MEIAILLIAAVINLMLALYLLARGHGNAGKKMFALFLLNVMAFELCLVWMRVVPAAGPAPVITPSLLSLFAFLAGPLIFLVMLEFHDVSLLKKFAALVPIVPFLLYFCITHVSATYVPGVGWASSRHSYNIYVAVTGLVVLMCYFFAALAMSFSVIRRVEDRRYRRRMELFIVGLTLYIVPIPLYFFQQRGSVVALIQLVAALLAWHIFAGAEALRKHIEPRDAAG